MRPLVYITVGYITGIIWGLYLKTSIAPIFFTLGGIIIAITIIIVKEIKLSGTHSQPLILMRSKVCIKYSNHIQKTKEKFFFIFKKNKKKILYSNLLFIIFTIISNSQIKYLETKHEKLYQNIEKVEVIGTIISDKKETNYKSSYTIKVESVNNNTKYKGTNLLIYVSKDKILDYGTKIRLKGNYEKPKEATNYKAFNYREYLKQKGVYGIVRVDKLQIIKKNNLNKIMIAFNNIRNKIKDNLKYILGDKSNITIGILLRRYI